LSQEAAVDHSIVSAWQQLTPALEEELVDFWLEQQVFAGDVPARARAREVVCIGRAADGRIAGVCSASPRIVARLRERLYYYRSFVRPADRRGGLAINLLLSAKQVLEAHEASLASPQCVGVILEIENRELADYHNQAYWHLTGFSFIGYSPRGLDLRTWYFEGARLQRLHVKASPARPAARRRPG
jgi:hypothetical protein